MAKQPFTRRQDCGQNGREGEGRIKEILPCPEIGPLVMPALYESVKVLEEPPKHPTHRKKKHEKTGATEQETVTAAAVCKGVDRDNICDPKGCEGMGLKSLKPCKTGPCNSPGYHSQ